MADESDYTRAWGGVFTPPADADSGIYTLDEAPDPWARRPADARDDRGGYYGPRERFGARAPPDEAARYARGSRALGRPDPRGMIVSSREGRRAVDDVVWDDRPPHFAAEAPNTHAHLFVDPGARGPPLFEPARGSAREQFSGPEKCGEGGGLPYETISVVLFFLALVLAALCFAQWLAAAVERRVLRAVAAMQGGARQSVYKETVVEIDRIRAPPRAPPAADSAGTPNLASSAAPPPAPRTDVTYASAPGGDKSAPFVEQAGLSAGPAA